MLFSGVSYGNPPFSPQLNFVNKSAVSPLGKTLTLSFDTTSRYCVGWYDLEKGQNHPCPDSALVDKKYDTCPACQNRTGFNPAFYHASTVSPQQDARNSEPHILYLAYMGKEYLKVGISHAQRDIRRLLDQGARAAIILDTFPSAHIARQYEAKIAALDSIHETTSTRTKLKLLTTPYDPKQARDTLKTTKNTIEQKLAVKFSGVSILDLDAHYFNQKIDTSEIITLKDPKISGEIVGILGDIIIASYDNSLIALGLRQYRGYPATITNSLSQLSLPAQQTSLF